MHIVRFVWLLALAVASITASAQTLYADRAGFLAAAGAVVTDDYESGYATNKALSDAEMSAVTGIAQYTATGNSQTNIVFGPNNGTLTYCAGCNGSFQLAFGAGASAVAFDYVNLPILNGSLPPTPYAAFVTYADASTASYALATRPDPVYPLPDFFGVTSDVPILSIHLGLSDGSATNLGGFVIDELSVAAVPEPASFLMLLLGVAAIGVRGACRHLPASPKGARRR